MPDHQDPTQTGRRSDIAALTAAMTLEEKASLTAGSDGMHTAALERLGIPPVKMIDGPNGAGGRTPSLCMPSGSALGATWDPETVREVAAAIAREARRKSARVLLAPTVNLHRHPLSGRNFESFSEDPLLSGRLVAAYVEGVQGEGVTATVKHLVCNEVEHERLTCSSEVDERTLRELYLLPFEFAVRESRAGAVMTAYNRLNGRYVPDDPRILSAILRGEWGFDGVVMSDWGGIASTAEAAEAGLDLEMPGPGRAFGAALADAVRRGMIEESCLDAKVRRIFGLLDRTGAPGRSGETGPQRPGDGTEARGVARRAASEAMVLLRNEGALLPLDPRRVRRIALIGPGAESPAMMGGGSAGVMPLYTLSFADVVREHLGQGGEVVVEPGCRLAADVVRGVHGPEGASDEHGDNELVARAARAAAEADAAIVVVGTNHDWESEGFDRTTMDLPGAQAELVGRVLRARPDAVVVINSGSPVSLPFAGAARALLQCWFGGLELANALADVVFGDAEPGGRLPMTMPERLEHTPAFGNFPGESGAVRYGEGQLVGYRWYDARRLPVAFPFGHGLSYTSMRIGPARVSTTTFGPGGTLSVEVDVENVGRRAGSEVVQLYVAPPSGGILAPGGRLRPVRSLKGFAKVRLAPGERTTVSIGLNERSFAYYDVADTLWPSVLEDLKPDHPYRVHGHRWIHRREAGWYVDAGRYEIQVGRSCQDICERLGVDVEGGPDPLPPTAPVG